MSSPHLDVTRGETAAICDYTEGLDARDACTFIRGSTCGVCGPITSSAEVHVATKLHMAGVAAYYAAMKSIILHSRIASLAEDGPVSKREAVVAYLAGRLDNSVVYGNDDPYYKVAVNYLLGRVGTPPLVRAFMLIRGTDDGRENGICVACMERRSTILFEGCSHLCMCATCLRRLQTRPLEVTGEPPEPAELPCPVCRARSATKSLFVV